MSNNRPVLPLSDAGWQRDLAKLGDWLATQKGGVGTFYEFQRRTSALRLEHQGHAALLRLLGDMAGRFADTFDGEPLDVSVASNALETLASHLRRVAALKPDLWEDYLGLLNLVGITELVPDC
jgi:hypothetical protein